ncbi:MAG TPA: penicillin-binding protein 2 [Candidatus Absconditabacterales bacterium]|nr:penicillin-binding protein 2 [Candidatus Absconditabacterales bacterium]HNG97073.1 penicillin-binding protein 2 [Candidatus Absconditabacterales bacterium]
MNRTTTLPRKSVSQSKRWSKIGEIVHHMTKEQRVLVGFVVLFALIIARLIQLQLIETKTYQNKLIAQHYQHINIKAKRGNIFVESPSGEPIQLTNNAYRYDIFIDPKFVLDKPKVINELIPIIIEHLCPSGSGGSFIDGYGCLKGLEQFTKKELLPARPALFYLGTGIVSMTGLNYLPTTTTGRTLLRQESTQLISGYESQLIEYDHQLNKTLSGVYYGMVRTMIQDKLNEIIQVGNKTKNFVTQINDPGLKTELNTLKLPFVIIEGDLMYVTPMTNSTDINKAGSILNALLSKYQIIFSYRQLRNLFTPQESRYVKLVTSLNQDLTDQLKQRKTYREDQKQHELAQKRKDKINYTQQDMVPLLHGLGFEQQSVREYPFKSFLSHVIGYLTKDGSPISGIEEYRDELLKGKDGQIIGFGTPWVGQGSEDELQLSTPVNGSDIILTIEPNIQKKIEQFTKYYLQDFKADSVSIIIMNPYDGSVSAMANAPDFDPNQTNSIYETKPLGPEYSRVLDDVQYMDIPVYIKTGGKLLPATLDDRFDNLTPKYINTNYYGPLSLVDKNTTLGYEPGSIFKPITVGIALDSDEVGLYDTYYDKGELQVGDYFIKNVSRACLGTNTILHALQFSCNIGMVNVIQKIGKHVFYNYLERLGFGKQTGIEIAGEVAGSIPNSQLTQKSRFFNNSFGQGLIVTPIQIAVAYSSLVNGGYLVKPTLIKYIKSTDGVTKQLPRQNKIMIFKDGVSDLMKNALYEVVNGGQIKRFAIAGKSLAGKTGTSQIPFRGKYQNGIGRTNGSFAGIITKDNTKYVIVIQVRRPRTSQRGELTAGKIYGELAKFLIEYEGIEK